MKKSLITMLSLCAMVALVAPVAQAHGRLSASHAVQALSQVAPHQGAVNDAAGTDAVLAKIDPRLLDLLKPGAGLRDTNAAVLARPVFVDVITQKGSGARIARLFEKSLVRSLPRRPAFDADLQPTPGALDFEIEFVSGLLRLDRVFKVASYREVTSVRKMGAEPPIPVDQPRRRPDLAALRQRVQDMQAGKIKRNGATPEAQGVAPNGWFEKTYVQWQRAWAAGYTGKGVDVAVLDSGIDFAHPDLNGLQARVIDPASPYFYKGAALSPDYGAQADQGIGLPIAFDATSLANYIFDVRNDAGNWGFYIDTSRKFIKSSFSDYIYVDGVRYKLPEEVKGSEVRVGFSSDNSLRFLWTPPDAQTLADIPILLANTGKVDLDRNGLFDDFDTVYTDLDNDHDFSNDKPAFLGDETMWWDGDSDGYADVSGGMLYFIADGVHPIPAIDWLYGGFVPDSVITPARGDLVALMVDDVTSPGGEGHGTRVASNIANRAIINGGAPPIKPPYTGPGDGIVQAAGKDARLIAMGNFYEGGSIFDWYLFSIFSYDGFADGPAANVDDPQLVNQSFGNANYEAGSYDVLSRLIGILNRFLNPYVLFATSAGNGGPNTGGVSSPDPWTGITIGASTQFAVPEGAHNGLGNIRDPVATLDQVTFGDITSFSDHGPDARGTAGVELAGNGDRGTGDVTLNLYADGWNAWEGWGGTSRATPTVLGTLTTAYQAWRERSGSWPSFLTAKTLAMSAASYNYHLPLETGAGISNAAQAALTAGGVYGTWTSPSLWNVGSYRGVDKQNTAFVNLLAAGESSSKTFTINNASAKAQSITLRDGTMQEVGTPLTGQLTSIDQAQETPFNVGKPDYLIPLSRDQIPSDTDLMVVRARHSLASFDPDDDAVLDSSWRVVVLDWTDLNKDGTVWTDLNGNGHVDATDANDNGVLEPAESAELEVGEYNRFNTSYPDGPVHELRVYRPLQRAHDGLFLSFQHETRSEKVAATTLFYEIRFYKLSDWDLLSLSKTALQVPKANGSAPGTAAFDATFTARSDTPPGYYEGYIFVDAAGTGAYVRVAHLSPDAPKVDVYLDDAKVLSNVKFRDISSYLPVTPGQHRLRITPAGAAPAGAAIDTTLDVADGTQYTVAATGTLAADDDAEFGAQVFVDENFSPKGRTAKLRVIHTAANAPAVDVYTGKGSANDANPGAKVIAGLPFGRASEYLFVPSGSYEIRVYTAGANPAVVAPLFKTSLSLGSGTTVNVFASGDAQDARTLRLVARADKTQLAFAAHTTAIPVTVDVAGNLSGIDTGGVATLGGSTARANTPHDNSFVHGIFNWSGNPDNRRFFIDTQDSVGTSSYLLTQTTWGDAKPTDIDTLILGPAADPCTNWFSTAACAQIGQVYDETFGPYIFRIVGSTGRIGGKPFFRFGTGTGGSEDWAAARITPGLHQVLDDNVLSGGEQFNIPFKTVAGIAQVTPAALEGTAVPAEFDVTFRTSLDLPEGLKAIGYGLSRPNELALTWAPGDAVGGIFPDKIYDFSAKNAGVIEINSSSPDIADIDIYLFYDSNGDGAFTPNEQIGLSAGSSAEESIRVKLPKDGNYRLVVVNFSNSAGTANVVVDVVQGTDIQIADLPATAVPAGTPVTFKVRVTGAPGSGTFKGILFLGPAAAPTAIEVPITMTVAAAALGQSTQATKYVYLPLTVTR